jgi:hypothetical protein
MGEIIFRQNNMNLLNTTFEIGNNSKIDNIRNEVKEIIDNSKYNTFDIADIVYTLYDGKTLFLNIGNETTFNRLYENHSFFMDKNGKVFSTHNRYITDDKQFISTDDGNVSPFDGNIVNNSFLNGTRRLVIYVNLKSDEQKSDEQI